MTKKAEEPRVLLKVPFSFREMVRTNARKRNMTMMRYLNIAVHYMEG